jgi:hypothetical protein
MEGLYHVGACVADGKKDFVFLAALGEVRRGEFTSGAAILRTALGPNSSGTL